MNKKYWVWIAVAVVVLAIIVYAGRKPGSQQTAGTNTNPVASQQAASTTQPASGQNGSSGSADNLSYNQALAIYQKSGYRFQFDLCHGKPGSLAIRTGAKFMIDNRDNQARTVAVKSQTFHLPAYGFAIVTAKELGSYNITCDGGGAAQLKVQP